MKTRFAPTPSGFLHRGNVYSFLLTWLIARQAGGRILLRIDDGDAARRRPEYVEDIFRTLEAFGLDWDEGPDGPDDFERNWSQRHRLPQYEEALREIADSPDVYACVCSRSQIREASPDGSYPGTCREKKLDLRANTPPRAWRLKIPSESRVNLTDIKGQIHSGDPAGEQGDFVIRRKNGRPAYQLSSVLDDLYFEIDTIIRGADLWSSTLSQVYLAEALQSRYPLFSKFSDLRFYHHELITDAAGQKLSKSAGVEAVGGWAESAANRREVLAAFAERWGIIADVVGNVKDMLAAWKERPLPE